ncbi:hypothetical protein [Rhizobium binae]|uniref:Uncharacterized protein n=1 Tax=Rhizobium binae TaxID=1138190 RepID=A0ABV2MRA5_9HYPH|nr:hypothetical protein [Rhizobium binae]NKL49104.1 hypothetical protein [Rhizobium leguminosarum bv. viciae]MBX4927472.1 hypothetical protein [Rhizobium binae]MBX4938817.1 hypothetical protein [Rhizobium binae]MBX4944658.1 hypothetical protein [Rhizobium binae]MBX4950956.1 hypothetical protein [Rhizobium binae]
MKFKVIEGGRGQAASTDGHTDDRPNRDDVRREAVRRLNESGYHPSRIREFVTGAPMPAALRYLSMQIDFAAEALSRLDPIPADFRSDGYWPASS